MPITDFLERNAKIFPADTVYKSQGDNPYAYGVRRQLCGAAEVCSLS